MRYMQDTYKHSVAFVCEKEKTWGSVSLSWACQAALTALPHCVMPQAVKLGISYAAWEEALPWVSIYYISMGFELQIAKKECK